MCEMLLELWCLEWSFCLVLSQAVRIRPTSVGFRGHQISFKCSGIALLTTHIGKISRVQCHNH